MFLASTRAASEGSAVVHAVFLGPTAAQMKQLGPPLPPGCNVQPLSAAVVAVPLRGNSSWVWRVDEVHDGASGATQVQGELWSFMVRGGGGVSL
jgi:hypothetical protein